MKIFINICLCVLFVCCKGTGPNKPVDQHTDSLQLLWSYEYSPEGWGTDAQPAVVGDSLLLITGDRYISCLRLDSGTVKWQFPVPGGGASYIQNILFDDNNFYGWQYRSGNPVYALNLLTGEKIWSIDSTAYYRFPGLSPTYYYSPYGYKFFKITKAGSVIDTVESTNQFRSLVYGDQRIFAGQYWTDGPNEKGRIVCYAEDSLDSLWGYNSSGGGFNMCVPQFENNTLYAGTVWGGSLGNEIVALNAETGTRLWRTETYGCYQIVLDGDVLYYAGGSSVNALDKNTGHVLWEAIIPTTDESSPLAYWDGYVYKAHGGTLFIFDATTGERVHYTYTFNGNTEYVYQVSTGAGKIFVQTSQHLYAFEPFNPEALSSNSGDAILQI